MRRVFKILHSYLKRNPNGVPGSMTMKFVMRIRFLSVFSFIRGHYFHHARSPLGESMSNIPWTFLGRYEKLRVLFFFHVDLSLLNGGL